MIKVHDINNAVFRVKISEENEGRKLPEVVELYLLDNGTYYALLMVCGSWATVMLNYDQYSDKNELIVRVVDYSRTQECLKAAEVMSSRVEVWKQEERR